jgi:16S rRNA (guanine(966)-N(2))-methyltransferase RsmD
LLAPKSQKTRPTGEPVREAIFNMLTPRVVGVSVLDLYAGSGALGLEALSRGADKAILVDSDKEAVRIIDHNLRDLGYQHRAIVKKMRAERFVNLAITAGWHFGVIFCDPPWTMGLSVDVRDKLYCILDPDGLVLVEHQKAEPPPVLDRLAPTRDRAWGDTRVTWYQVPVKGDLS